MTLLDVPLPPAELAVRVGVEDRSDPLASFEAVGRRNRDMIVGLLPEDWTFAGKRVLDFGCGPGKVLRFFLEEAEQGEFYGCDIHAPSIDWLERNLSPPLRVFVNEELPPLPFEDGQLDLVLASSVFTHLADSWSAWLLELHRILADGGLLIASFLGEGLSEDLAGEPWVEERIGMNVLDFGQDWELGGPTVFLSEWWIRAHWGRAFDFVVLQDNPARGAHGTVVARKRGVTSALSRELLEAPEPNEPREFVALRHQVHQLRREAATLHAALRAAGPTPS